MGVMEIASDVHDLSAVGDVMEDRGWKLDRQQGGLHLMLSPYHLRVVDEFLSDLAAAVAAPAPTREATASYGGVAQYGCRHPSPGVDGVTTRPGSPAPAD